MATRTVLTTIIPYSIKRNTRANRPLVACIQSRVALLTAEREVDLWPAKQLEGTFSVQKTRTKTCVVVLGVVTPGLSHVYSFSNNLENQ